MSLLGILVLVDHARRENPGMRGSTLLRWGGPSPGRRVVEMLLRGVYSVKRAGPAGRGPLPRNFSERPATFYVMSTNTFATVYYSEEK